MKVNANTVIVGSKVVLVPYEAHHVPKYHEWMLNDDLRELTASEQLPLEKEYEMQRKWQIDEDKLTFIILARNSADLPVPHGQLLLDNPALSLLPMVGDVNIFLYGSRTSLSTPPVPITSEGEEVYDDSYAEVEIMIAETAYRRGGFASEALQLMLGYASGHPEAFARVGDTAEQKVHLIRALPPSPLCISPHRFMVKVGSKNEASVKLFQKLGFQITKHINVFDEVEMRLCF